MFKGLEICESRKEINKKLEKERRIGEIGRYEGERWRDKEI